MNLSTTEQKQFQLRYAAGTDIGRKREENQDSFGVVQGDDFHVFVVADGMGGVKGGAVASKLAIAGLEESLKDLTELSDHALRAAVQVANKRIYQRGSEDGELTGMGTTLVALGFLNTKMLVANVGDSRAYRLRGSELLQLTTDHTLVQELVRAGSLTEEQAEQHPVSHMLTRSLGPSEDVGVDCEYFESDPEEGDRYLLCSDGLYNLVSVEEIGEILSAFSLDDAIQELINLANERGGTDNITVIVIQVGEFEVNSSRWGRRKEGLRGTTERRAITPGRYGRSAETPGGRRRYERRFIIGGFLLAFVGGYLFGPLMAQRVSRWSGGSQAAAGNPIATSFTPFLPSNLQSAPEPLAPSLGAISNEDTPKIESRTPALPPENYILTDVDISDIERRKASLEKTIVDINEKLRALEQPPSNAAQLLLQQATTDWNAVRVELEAVKRDIETATRKLAVWYTRRKKAASNDPVNLAGEVAVTSSAVQKRKEQFERDTWEYLQNAEALRYGTGDKSLEQKVADLTKQRNASMQALAVEVRSTIEMEVSKADQLIAEYTVKKDKLESRLHATTREMEFARALLSTSQENRESVRKELIREREATLAELNSLRALVPADQRR